MQEHVDRGRGSWVLILPLQTPNVILILPLQTPSVILEKAMATNSSTLAWQIPWMEEPGRLQFMGSLRVGHDWTTSLSFFTFMHWRRKWQPTLVFLPGESQGQRSLEGCHLWGCRVGHDWRDLAAAAVLYDHHILWQRILLEKSKEKGVSHIPRNRTHSSQFKGESHVDKTPEV